MGAEVSVPDDDVLSMFGDPAHPLPPLARVRVKGSIEKRFEEFHRLNPHVYEAIVKIALDLKARGFEECGISLIFERLRWIHAIQTRGDSFRLNNDFRAFYARVVMEAVPELRDFFRVRKQTEGYVPDLEALGIG